MRIADRPTIPEDEWKPIAKARTEVAKLEEQRKQKGDDLDQLNKLIAKLTKEVADKRSAPCR